MGKVVTIIVPTYKERENITSLVERISNSLSKWDYEILIVDDNSQDGSEELVRTLSGKYPVRILVRKNKRGLASAVVDGISQAQGKLVAVMDADLQHPPEVLPEILKALENHDFVMASRYIQGGSPGKWTFSRKIVSFVANTMALPLAPKIKDRMSGFFAFRRSAVDPAALNPLGWKIGLEILARSQFKSTAEVPFTFAQRARGASKLTRWIIWQYIQQLVRLYLSKFQILNFMVVGGIGYVINIGLYSLLTLMPALKTFQFEQVGKSYYLPPFVVSSLVAIICNYLMNKAWTFKGWKEQRLGSLRYFLMALVTLFFDMAFLFLLVEFVNIPPVPAAAIAILIVFVVRFIIARNWVWRKALSKRN